MRVEFRTDGGLAVFPGLARPVSIDAGELSRGDADELERLVGAARFFERPGVSGEEVGEPPGADRCRYTITVEEERRSRTLCLADPIIDLGLASLVVFLSKLARGKRVGAPGGGAAPGGDPAPGGGAVPPVDPS